MNRAWRRLAPVFRRAGLTSAVELDPVFYAKHYPDLRQFDEAGLRRHYIKHGRREGRHASLVAARATLRRAGRVLPLDFDATFYRLFNTDLASLFDEPWQYELHYLEHGQAEGRVYRGSAEATADVAIELREAGDLAASAMVVDWLCRTYPKIPFGWREKAALHKLQGDDQGMLACLTRTWELDQSALSLRQLVRHLAGLGRVREARTYIKAFRPRNAEDEEWADLLDQLTKFMTVFPHKSARRMIDDIVATPRFVHEPFIDDMLRTALAQGWPLSLIRLGDGEGAWLTELDDQGGRYERLYLRNRREILYTWYGNDGLLERGDFTALIQRLKDAVAHASIIGIPYPKRVDWEYKIASLDGLPSCVKLLRIATSLSRDPDRLFCSHDIHFGLQLSGVLKRILQTRCRVGVICCYPGLAMKLHEMYGVEIVANLSIPEEKGMSDIIGPNGMGQRHFPDVFDRIVERLRAGDWTSTLWLVAAGFLGKIYCEEIRARSGIALDIGSLADGWMGKKTRPTLANELWSYQL